MKLKNKKHQTPVERAISTCEQHLSVIARHRATLPAGTPTPDMDRAEFKLRCTLAYAVGEAMRWRSRRKIARPAVARG